MDVTFLTWVISPFGCILRLYADGLCMVYGVYFQCYEVKHDTDTESPKSAWAFLPPMLFLSLSSVFKIMAQ